mmetsp:Transcript_44005/g.58385  ORF Transcript_44005/g.58385 Transcript_44005/m.58385 type:complete len:96 (-) Transcript_44005:358-645(-)
MGCHAESTTLIICILHRVEHFTVSAIALLHLTQLPNPAEVVEDVGGVLDDLDPVALPDSLDCLGFRQGGLPPDNVLVEAQLEHHQGNVNRYVQER